MFIWYYIIAYPERKHGRNLSLEAGTNTGHGEAVLTGLYNASLHTVHVCVPRMTATSLPNGSNSSRAISSFQICLLLCHLTKLYDTAQYIMLK